MRGWGILYRLARADVLERVRRYSFLIALAASLWLLYLALTGQLKMYLGDYRGVYNSAWTGLLMALSAGTFVSLAGFYVVKGSVEQDRRTGVGQILAATRIRKMTYLLSKFLSNLTVLSAILAVLGVAAIVLQAVYGEISTVNPWQLLSPLLLLAMPTMAMVAAVAVFFETVSWLRGGFGNVVYFLLWNFVLVMPIANDWAQVDLLGLRMAEEILQDAASSRFPDYNGDFAFGLGSSVDLSQKQTFVWEGIPWNAPLLQNRLVWTLLAVLLVVLGSVWFERFDPSTSPLRGASHTGAGRAWQSLRWRKYFSRCFESCSGVALASWWRPNFELHSTASAPGGMSYWQRCFWWPSSRRWIWRSMSKSTSGSGRFWCGPNWARESDDTRPNRCSFRHHNRFVVSFSPRGWPASSSLLPRHFQFSCDCCWPVKSKKPVALCCGAAFIPTLALAAGVWSQSSKLFEAVYLVWWYLGPVHCPRAAGLHRHCL